MNRLELTGCSPEPLMSYLKALGILRLVNEQKDPKARGWWKGDVFYMETNLTLENLSEFFVDDYGPTPVVVPWSGGDFFGVDEKEKFRWDGKKTPSGSAIVDAFLASHDDRLEKYRSAIRVVLGAFKPAGIDKKEEMKEEKKSLFISIIRANCQDEGLMDWIDAAAVLAADKPFFNALLGSGGGSDGNTHFSDNFMQNLWEVLPAFDEQKKPVFDKKPDGETRIREVRRQSEALLGNALVGLSSDGLVLKRTSALFDSGAVGGPNAGQGFERVSLTNPWNFILALEGSLCFAGAAVKRMGTEFSGRSFPFMLEFLHTETGTSAPKETGNREFWAPLWDKKATCGEVERLLAEGRAEVGTRQPRNGVEMARSIASLQTDRGFRQFVRYAIVKGRVGGENYTTASALGRFETPKIQSGGLILLNEVDRWLNRFRSACGDKAPQRFQAALHHIDTAIFNYCRYGGAERFCSVLQSLGSAERELALTSGQIGQSKFPVPPLGGLSFDWIIQANDNSPEFELALALASVGWDRGKPGSYLIRRNLEAVDLGKGRVQWAEKDKRVVWNRGGLHANLAAVLYRRLMDAGRNADENSPVLSLCGASLEAITRLIHGEIDEQRLEDLLWGMTAIDFSRNNLMLTSSVKSDGIIPRAYSMLKLLFLPYGFVRVSRSDGSSYWRPCLEGEKGFMPRPELRILNLLETNRVAEACKVAYQRLKAGGIEPMPGLQDQDLGGVDGSRLAAALLVPIDTHTMGRLASMVLRKPETQPQEEGEPSHVHQL